MGTIQGTNNGAVFAEFLSTKDGVSGVVHINDSAYGVGIYSVAGGEVSPDVLRLVLTPDKQARMAGHGIVTVIGHMTSQTQFDGEWRSSIGTAGALSVTKVEVHIGQPPKPQNGPTMMTSDKGALATPARTKVFISYSHHDLSWLERLRVHLKPLERDYALDIWDDRNIRAGSKWLEEIERAIQSAKVVLAIITADFLASDFITNNELPPLLDAAKKDGAVIMPLIVSPSRFMSTKTLSQFQAVNDPALPLINLTRGEQEAVLVKVTENIESIIKPLLIPMT